MQEDIIAAVGREWQERHGTGRDSNAEQDTPVTLALAEVLVSLLDADDRAPDGRCHVCDAGIGERHSGNCPFAAAARAEAVLAGRGVTA